MKELIYKPNNPNLDQYMTSNGDFFPIEKYFRTIETFEDYLDVQTENTTTPISTFLEPDINLYSLNVFNINAKEAEEVISKFHNFYKNDKDKKLFVSFRKYCDSNPSKFLGFAFLNQDSEVKFEKDKQVGLIEILKNKNLKSYGKFILKQRTKRKIIGHFYERFF